MVNVRDSQFGVVADGFTDDRAAIQRAIDYAKSLSVSGNANVKYRATVFFPAGYYFVGGPLNITNTNGMWLVGDGGPYLNTIITGNTGGVIFDFSGSSLSGCENFSFISSDRGNASTIGTLFALTDNGGLNCGIRNCYFELSDNASANGGFGSIGILDVRSEEFYIHDCTVRANTPLILSHRSSLNISGANFNAASSFATLSSGTGSMGNVCINGTSLQAVQKRQPAMVLVSTNSISFQGFLARTTTSQGSNETAILCVNYTTNLKVQATIESFSRALQVRDAGFEGNDIDIVVANSTAPTTELVDLSGCIVKGFHLRVSLPNTSERANRYVVYHAPNSDANTPAAGSILNGDISCYDIVSNQYIISPNLLRRTTNVVFNTFQPFEKKGGRTRQLSNNNVSLSNGNAATVFRFTQADNFSSTNGRGGYYRIWIDGVIRAGGYGSGGSSVLSFQAQVIINQNNTGALDSPSATVIILDKSTTNPDYIDIQGLFVNISFANNIGSITVTPRITGSGNSEAAKYDGVAEMQSDFLVNDPIPLSL